MPSPTEVLADLQRVNARFWLGAAAPRGERLRASGADPEAVVVVILGCSGPRVPMETRFA